MKGWMGRLSVALAVLAGAGQVGAADGLFAYRMPWDDVSANLTNLADWNAKPAGRDGFVRVQDGHLYAGKERLRLLGVNIVFGSMATDHATADKLAARLARFGVNIVRLHHMDSAASPRGLLQKDKRTFDEAQLERLDYFIAALKREGIYSDINLHVGRMYPGFAAWGETTPKYWKGVDNFYSPMIEMQKEYAQELLLHRNPYTGNRYVEEPAVAIIEINNENGLLREWRSGNLNDLHEPYRGELKRLWQTWLRAHYADGNALRQAWGLREEPLGAEMLGAAINVKSSEAGWNPQIVGEARATLTRNPDGILDLAMTQAGSENWHIQLHQQRLSFKAGQPYTLTLRVRADKPLHLGLQAMQAHAPWQQLWSQNVAVGTEWCDVSVTFAPTASEEAARLTLGRIGEVTGHLYIASASLRPGGMLGLRPGEDLAAGTIDILGSDTLLSRTPAGQRDWLQFLWDTERTYWLSMRDYLRVDLGAKPLIVGTQVSYSPAPIQAELDVVDGHAYWQHPAFPGKPWDLNNWRIGNSPMAGINGAGTLADLALRRAPGKPFIVTEYNHPHPSLYQGEALPLAAAYAALQDWDGIFVYSYGAHTANWDPGFIENFFDSHANPVKMSSLIAAAALLRRSDVAAAPPVMHPAPSGDAWLAALRTTPRIPGAESFGAARNQTLLGRVDISTPAGMSPALPVTSVTGELAWGLPGVDDGRTVSIDTARSKALIGARLAKMSDLHGVGLQLTRARNDWGVLMATVIEGRDFSSPGKILITALGQEENSGQRWIDDKKISLGRNFGSGPVLVEGLGARISLPLPVARVHAWALDERGMRREAVPITGAEQATLEIGERYHALWYEVEVR